MRTLRGIGCRYLSARCSALAMALALPKDGRLVSPFIDGRRRSLTTKTPGRRAGLETGPGTDFLGAGSDLVASSSPKRTRARLTFTSLTNPWPGDKRRVRTPTVSMPKAAGASGSGRVAILCSTPTQNEQGPSILLHFAVGDAVLPTRGAKKPLHANPTSLGASCRTSSNETFVSFVAKSPAAGASARAGGGGWGRTGSTLAAVLALARDPSHERISAGGTAPVKSSLAKSYGTDSVAGQRVGRQQVWRSWPAGMWPPLILNGWRVRYRTDRSNGVRQRCPRRSTGGARRRWAAP